MVKNNIERGTFSIYFPTDNQKKKKKTLYLAVFSHLGLLIFLDSEVGIDSTRSRHNLLSSNTKTYECCVWVFSKYLPCDDQIIKKKKNTFQLQYSSSIRRKNNICVLINSDYISLGDQLHLCVYNKRFFSNKNIWCNQ